MEPTPGQTLTLRRELGKWDLTAIGVNQVIGAAVFAQPSLYAASVGAWSPWMVAAVGLASLLIALSFSSAASTAMVQAQDVLGLGSEARMNTPGTAKGAWQWGLEELPSAGVAARLREVTEEAGRLP